MMQADEIRCAGDLRVGGAITPARPRTELAVDAGMVFAVPVNDWRVHDAYQTLIATPGNDDLGIVGDAFGTDCPYVSSGDLKAAGATTRYARRTFQIPAEYVAGQAVKIRLSAGMITTVASVSATLDVEAYLSGRDGTKDGADLCTLAAQNINSLTFADFDFTITPTDLEPGSELDVRIAIAVNDAATATAVIGAVGAAALVCDSRG